MKRGVKETIGSLACVVAILATLAWVDPRVRMKASAILADPVGGAVTPFGNRVADFAGALFDALKDQSLENAPLLVFAVVGGVLFLFMFKT